MVTGAWPVTTYADFDGKHKVFMIEIIESGSNELQRFLGMERDTDVAPIILPYSIEQHVGENLCSAG